MDTIIKLLNKIGYDLVKQNMIISGYNYEANNFIINYSKVRYFLSTYNLPELDNMETIMYQQISVGYLSKNANSNIIQNPNENEMRNIELYNSNLLINSNTSDINVHTKDLNGMYTEFENMYRVGYANPYDQSSYNSQILYFYIAINPVVQVKVKKSDNKEYRQYVFNTELKDEAKNKMTLNEKRLILDNNIESCKVNHNFVSSIKYCSQLFKKYSEKVRVVSLDDSCLYSDKTDPLVFALTFLTYPYFFDRVFFNIYNYTLVNSAMVTQYVEYISCASLEYIYNKSYDLCYFDIQFISPNLLLNKGEIQICRDINGYIIDMFLKTFSQIATGNSHNNIINENSDIRQVIYLDIQKINNNLIDLNIKNGKPIDLSEVTKEMHQIIIDDQNYQFGRDFFIILPKNKKLHNNKLVNV